MHITRTEGYESFVGIADAFLISLKILNIAKDSVKTLSFSQDHREAGCNGKDYFKNIFNQSINLLDCETHVRRNVDKKKFLLGT